MKIQTVTVGIILTVLALSLVQATVLYTEDDYRITSGEQCSLSRQTQEFTSPSESIVGSCEHLRQLCCVYGGDIACRVCAQRCSDPCC